MKKTIDYAKAIDVNANIPFQSVKGYEFVFIKFTEGVGYSSPAASKWVEQCRKDKVPYGLYHYARPDTGNNVSDEVEYFLAQLEKYPDCKAVALDWEDKSLRVKDGELWAYNWLCEVYRKTLSAPLIYLSASEAKKAKYAIISEYFPLWLAQWGAEPDMSAWDTWRAWYLWQWTNKPLDCDYVTQDFIAEYLETVSRGTQWTISKQSKESVTVKRDDGLTATLELTC